MLDSDKQLDPESVTVLARLRQSWEFAAVGQFLFMFWNALKLEHAIDIVVSCIVGEYVRDWL